MNQSLMNKALVCFSTLLVLTAFQNCSEAKFQADPSAKEDSARSSGDPVLPPQPPIVEPPPVVEYEYTQGAEFVALSGKTITSQDGYQLVDAGFDSGKSQISRSSSGYQLALGLDQYLEAEKSISRGLASVQ